MAITVNVQEAKTRLSELLRRVEAGEPVTIARAGQAIARLEPVAANRRSFASPLVTGLRPIDASVLLEPLTDDELRDWETGHPRDPLGEGAA